MLLLYLNRHGVLLIDRHFSRVKNLRGSQHKLKIYKETFSFLKVDSVNFKLFEEVQPYCSVLL